MATTAAMPLYEGMFLFPQSTSANLASAQQFLDDVFQRAEAEVVAMRRWDERKLAYPIKNQKRGVYVLVYFRARGSQIANIERDCTLSEQVLRCMILRADHLGETELELETRETPLAVEAKLRSEEGGADRRSEDRGAARAEADTENDTDGDSDSDEGSEA